MLLKRPVLDAIIAGDVDLVFRRWKRPTVKAGGTLRTAVGMRDIVAVDRIDPITITDGDARRAGLAHADLIRDQLSSRSVGDVYRIMVRPGGPDPRELLRADADLDADAMAEVVARLSRLDTTSARGPWIRDFLKLLSDHPHVRAQDLAASIGLDKPTFKRDVRKLKALGFTISHSPGYELSPRGRAVLAHLERRSG